MTEALLVLLGFLLGVLPGMRQRRRQGKGHLASIEVELAQCREGCVEFAHRKVLAPLYRLPITLTSAALPWLISEGFFEPKEHDAISRVVMLIDQVNRGLDRLAEFESSDDAMARVEFDRVQLKVGHLLQDRDGGAGKLSLASDAVRSARERVWFS